MFKKFLLITALSISLFATTYTETMALDVGSAVWHWGFSYEGCFKVQGVGGPPGEVLMDADFVPTDATLVALNNSMKMVLVGLGHSVSGVSTGLLPALINIDEYGNVWVCVDLASRVDECDDPDLTTADPNDFRFGTPGTPAADRRNCADWLPEGTTPNDPELPLATLEDAWMQYWGISWDELKPNEHPYEILINSVDASALITILQREDSGFFSCYSPTDPRFWYEEGAYEEHICVAAGAPVGIDDAYTFKKNSIVSTVSSNNGVLSNDVDTDGLGTLTVTDVQYNGLGDLTVNLDDGSFVWDLTDVDFPKPYVVEWTYIPSDGTSQGNTVTVTMTHQ